MLKNIMAGLVVTVLFASASQAVTRVISINFDDGSNPIGVGVPAGLIPAVGWNEAPTNSNAYILQDNAGVTDMDGFGANVKFTTALGFNGATETPGGTATAGDLKLFARGTRSVWDGNTAEATQVLLEGLATAFPNGYDVYIYIADTSYDGFARAIGTNTIYESNTLGDYTAGRNNSPINTPVGSTDTQNYAISDGTAFLGTYTQGQNYVLFSGKSADTAVYTMFMNKVGPNFNWGTFTGMQIVGEVGNVPEPSTLALACIGLVGLVGYGLRRRMQK